MWRIGSERPPLVLRGFADGVELLELKEDGSAVAAAANGVRHSADDRSAGVWDCQSGEQLGLWNIEVEPIRHLAFTAEGICVGGSNNTLYGLRIGERDISKRHRHDGKITRLRAVGRGGVLLVADSKQMLSCLARIESRPEIGRHHEAVRAIDVAADGRCVVSGGEDGRVLRVDSERPDSVRSSRATRSRVAKVKCLPETDGSLSIGVDRNFHRPGETRSDLGVDSATACWRVGSMTGEVSFFTVLPRSNTVYIAHGVCSAFGAADPAGMWPDLYPKLYVPKDGSFSPEDLRTTRPVPNLYWRSRLIKLGFSLPLRPENIRFDVLNDDLPRLSENSFVTPDGRYLVGAGDDGILRVIDLRGGQIVSQVAAGLECSTVGGDAAVCRMPTGAARLVKLSLPDLECVEDLGEFSDFDKCAILGRGHLLLSDRDETRAVNLVDGTVVARIPGSLRLTPSHCQWFGVSQTSRDLVLVDSTTFQAFAGYGGLAQITCLGSAESSDYLAVGYADGSVHHLEIVGSNITKPA